LSPTIRPARAADEGAILSLARPFATSFAIDERAFHRAYGELLTSTEALVLVAESESAIVGYLLGFDHPTFYANGRVAWVEELMVGEAWRRQRVGASLMRAFEDWARGRGCRLVALATRRAAAFYTATGYEESATFFRKLLLA
jgi:GNAT superfamily N-acetyltransferase